MNNNILVLMFSEEELMDWLDLHATMDSYTIRRTQDISPITVIQFHDDALAIMFKLTFAERLAQQNIVYMSVPSPFDNGQNEKSVKEAQALLDALECVLGVTGGARLCYPSTRCSLYVHRISEISEELIDFVEDNDACYFGLLVDGF
jgi:hypothetical protein